MGLFGSNSPFDADIEKATNENNTTDQWGLILEICDRVGGSSVNAKECLRSVMRRLGHTDPHVVIQAITLLDALVSNCGKPFHLEVASREFENEFCRLMKKHQPTVAQRMAGLLKKWSEGEFKTDPSLSLIPSLCARLKQEGVSFSAPEGQAVVKAEPVLSKDPNVVSSQQEMDDIAKAIELSLKESPMKHAAASSATKTTSSSFSLYPTTSLSTATSNSTPAGGASSSSTAHEARKVRALYDFEAAEDNELSFVAGDLIHVTDDSDPNWWKGYNQRDEGLFPASFVTADLSVEPESLRLDLNNKSNKKFVQFADDVKDEDEVRRGEEQVVEINEEKLDRLLHLLHEANPEDPAQDTQEMLSLETMVNQMGPLIDTELERVDRTHAQLARLSVGLVDAFNLYHSLMREAEKPPHYMGYGQPMFGHHPSMAQQQPGSLPPMMMNQQGHMYSPQHQSPLQQGPGMSYNMPGMPPPNGQFPVSSPGPVSMPMMGPVSSAAASQSGQMPGMSHQQMPGMQMNMGTPPQTHHHAQQQQQQQQPIPNHHQTPPHAHMQQQHPQNGQNIPNSHPQPQQQQQQPHITNPNTETSSSIGAPISHPGQPPSFASGPPGGAMNGFPQMPMHGGGAAGPPPPQQQQQHFNPAAGQGMPPPPQFQPMTTHGVGSQPAPPPPPAPQMMMGVSPGMPQMGNFNPMMMMGAQQQPPQSSVPVSSMMHPQMSMGSDMNIPVYQQQR